MTTLPDRSPSPAPQSNPLRRRFRDFAARQEALTSDGTSPLRLAGYFVGGILFANLVLILSAALFGRALHPSVKAQDADHMPVATIAAPLVANAETDGVASPDPEAPVRSAPPRPMLANLCADAREKLVDGLTRYYLQRSQRPDASAEEVLESASASALLAGPSDPAAVPSGVPCGN